MVSTQVMPRTVAQQAPLSMEYWNGLPIPSPVDFPGPGIELGSPALQADSLPTELPGKPTQASRKGQITMPPIVNTIL